MGLRSEWNESRDWAKESGERSARMGFDIHRREWHILMKMLSVLQ